MAGACLASAGKSDRKKQLFGSEVDVHVRGLQCAQQAGSSLKWPHSLSVTTRAAGEPGAEEVSSIADSQ